MIKKLFNWIKSSKGVMTAKGKYVNYREAHKCQYGFLKGLMTFRPSTARKNLEVNQMDFMKWENGNNHYQDTCFIVGYTIKFVGAGVYSPEILHNFLIPLI